MNNGNSYLNTKRRKFLIKLVGATIGFSISSIQNITTSLVVAQRPIFNYAIRLVLASGLILIIFPPRFGGTRRQSRLSQVRFDFRIDNPPVGTQVNFDIYIQDANGNVLPKGARYIRKTITPEETGYWLFWFTWSGSGYAPPLYLTVVSGDKSVSQRFY